MPRALKGREAVRILERAGFTQIRQASSYVILKGPAGSTVSVPIHGAKDIRKGTLKSIIRQSGLGDAYFWSHDQ